MTISDSQSSNRIVDADPGTPKRPGLNTDTVAMGGLFVAIFAFVAAVFAVALAARAVEESRSSGGSGGSGGSTSEAVTVTLSEYGLTPGNVKASAGSTIDVVNKGTMIHNLSVDGVASPMLDGGKSAELDLAKLKPGTYKMRCDVPGHEDAGMKGTLTVD